MAHTSPWSCPRDLFHTLGRVDRCHRLFFHEGESRGTERGCAGRRGRLFALPIGRERAESRQENKHGPRWFVLREPCWYQQNFPWKLVALGDKASPPAPRPPTLLTCIPQVMDAGKIPHVAGLKPSLGATGALTRVPGQCTGVGIRFGHRRCGAGSQFCWDQPAKLWASCSALPCPNFSIFPPIFLHHPGEHTLQLAGGSVAVCPPQGDNKAAPYMHPVSDWCPVLETGSLGMQTQHHPVSRLPPATTTNQTRIGTFLPRGATAVTQKAKAKPRNHKNHSHEGQERGGMGPLPASTPPPCALLLAAAGRNASRCRAEVEAGIAGIATG